MMTSYFASSSKQIEWGLELYEYEIVGHLSPKESITYSIYIVIETWGRVSAVNKTHWIDLALTASKNIDVK